MKNRVIYSNYFNQDKFGDCRQLLMEHGIENPSDDEIFTEMEAVDCVAWEDLIGDMDKFFNGGLYIVFGTVERWDRISSGFDIVECFEDILKMLRDCDEIEFSDQNGHLIVNGAHHDGVVNLELRELNDRGIQYYENWNSSWDDNRTEGYVGKKLRSDKYSRLPRYCEKVWGY